MDRMLHSSALDIAGFALGAALLLEGSARVHYDGVLVVAGWIILSITLIGAVVAQLRPAETVRPERWLGPRRLLRASREYAKRGVARRLLVWFDACLLVLAVIRLGAYMTRRWWILAVSQLLLVVFWLALAEHYGARAEAAIPSADVLGPENGP